MDRRSELLAILKSTKEPLAGTLLAERLDVSRQTIVQDIAFLRKDGAPIISTTQGYVLSGPSKPEYREVLGIMHSPEMLRRELEILVSHHVAVEDVFILHPVYGRIRGMLGIITPLDLKTFLAKRSQSEIPLFSEVTGGLHYHTLVAEAPEMITEAKKALQEEGFQLVDPTT